MFRKGEFMKKILVVLLLTLLVGCSQEKETDKINVISTIFPGYN